MSASSTIGSMKDLPDLEEELQAQSARTISQSSQDIIILYNEEAENNIGNLGLKSSDFKAGKSLNNQVDLLRISGQTSAEDLIENISKKASVAAVSLDEELTPSALPNDSAVSQQYYYTNTGMNNAWNQGGKTSVKVALLDSGVNTSHEDLKNRIEMSGIDYSGENFKGVKDFTGHGTEVAGIIAAETNNGVGIAGMSGSANVKVVPYRVTRSDGSAPLSYFVSAVTDICNRDDIRIINISYGMNHSSDVQSRVYEMAEKANKVVIASSGNSGDSSVCYPAAYSSVVAVGGVNQSNSRCTSYDWGSGNGSNYGSGLNLVAPANQIFTTDNNGGYIKESGTSFATPMVSGIAALMLSKNSALSNTQVRNILYTSAKDLGSPGYDLEYGYGLVRADAALSQTSATNQVIQPSKPSTNTGTTTNLLDYNAHIQNIGWMTPVGNGSISGTTGKGLRLEAFRIDPKLPGLIVQYNAFIEKNGWQGWRDNGKEAGTTGQGLRIEAVKMKINGSYAKTYDIYYRTHVQNVGWTNWSLNGQENGTIGTDLRIEAMQIKVVPKGSGQPSYDSNVNWTYTANP